MKQGMQYYLSPAPYHASKTIQILRQRTDLLCTFDHGARVARLLLRARRELCRWQFCDVNGQKDASNPHHISADAQMASADNPPAVLESCLSSAMERGATRDSAGSDEMAAESCGVVGKESCSNGTIRRVP